MPIFVPADASEIFSPCHCAVLRKASRYVSQVYDTALAPAGLKTTQFSLLAAIDRAHQGATLQEVADVMVMDRSTLGHNLRPLERDGLVRLATSRKDARQRQISLTPKGRARLQKARQLWKKMQTQFESAFGADPTIELRHALLKLTTTKLKTS